MLSTVPHQTDRSPTMLQNGDGPGLAQPDPRRKQNIQASVTRPKSRCRRLLSVIPVRSRSKPRFLKLLKVHSIDQRCL